MIQWLLVFTATVIADYWWAKWAAHVHMRNPWKAGAYSALITVSSGFTILEYTRDHWLLIPAVLGAIAGTVWAVRQF
jgi:hypothetical protein